MTDPTEKARELVKRISSGKGSCFQDEVQAIAQALTEAEQRGREAGLEEARDIAYGCCGIRTCGMCFNRLEYIALKGLKQ